MLVLIFGLAANWLWWAALDHLDAAVAIVWAPMWRRMRIMTTAELITLRYGGRARAVARKIYATVCCFGFSVLLIRLHHRLFCQDHRAAGADARWQILLIFGGTTALYTMFGGLMGVVVTEILHFVILMSAAPVFAWSGGGATRRVGPPVGSHRGVRPESLARFAPVRAARARQFHRAADTFRPASCKAVFRRLADRGAKAPPRSASWRRATSDTPWPASFSIAFWR